MGADLYLKHITDPARAEWQPKFDEAVRMRDAATDDVARDAAQKLVSEAYDRMYPEDGYFRDSYNGTSVLHRLGLSWWRDLEHDVEYDEEKDAYPGDVNVSSDACRRFLQKVRAAELEPVTEAWLRSHHCSVDDGENSVEAWNNYYREKRDRLIAFLERAIEHGGMYAST